MRKKRLQTFEDEMVERLRAGFADFAARHDEQALRALIRLGIERACAHGITRAGNVSRYIESMLIHGPDFDSQPWAAPILATKRMSGAAKMDTIDAFHPYLSPQIASPRR